MIRRNQAILPLDEDILYGPAHPGCKLRDNRREFLSMATQVSSLSNAELAGQLLFIGIEGTCVDASLRSRLREVGPGGIILFARNLEDAPQVAAICRELGSVLEIPPFLAIDQEGGRVSRLKGIFPVIPANLRLASLSQGESKVREHGLWTGRGLSLLGFNLNFAPVLDLSGAEDPNGIGDRAYGADPARVARLARIFLEAQAASGVAGCGKHFPGLGGGRVDSHLELPRIDRSAETLWREDLAPYRALRSELPVVMVGHAHYPALQGDPPVPATLSSAIVSDLLRRRIGYEGIALTDDLEMGAVDQKRGAGEVTLEALGAGNDMVMYCKSWERVLAAHDAILRSLDAGEIARPLVEVRVARILALKGRLPGPYAAPSFDPAEFGQICRGLEGLEDSREA
jgi:beta-N-acetylhexosaminidase